MSRAELRDLQDLRALLEAGGDLERAVTAAPMVDGGFSPLTFAWVLSDFKVKSLAAASGLTEEETDRLC